MTLIYEPLYDLDRLIDSTFNDLSSSHQLTRTGDVSNQASRPLRPRMDLHEDSKKNTITATFELPGLKKDDVNIQVEHNRLTVSGEASSSKEYDESGYAVRERRFGNFSRTLPLPKNIKEDQIKASLDNGLLTVTFLKSSHEDSGPQKITIN